MNLKTWVLAAAALAGAETDLVLVSKGATPYEIVRSETAPASVQTAARELAHFVERASGARLLIVAAPSAGKKHIFVGSGPHSPAEGLKPEGFRFRTVGDDLHIVGVDTPGNPAQVKRTQPVQCGTLFGVYEFLERYLGVLFAWHDELGTVVPARPEIRIPQVDLTQAPDWSSRTLTNSPSGAAASTIFGRRLRLGGSVQTDYTHNWFRILPVEKYGTDHPDYFALVGGRRKTANYDRNHGGQRCTTHPEVIDLFAKAAVEAFNRNPGDEVFPISPNDGKGFCECAACVALDPPVTGRAPILSDRMMTFYNAVAEKVVQVHPRKYLGAFVYARYQSPPLRVRPHPNLRLTHATNSGFSQGMRWKQEHEDEQAWASMSSGVIKYDIYYYSDYGGMHLPAPVTAHLTEKLRAEHRVGFRGGYLYMGPSYEALGAGHYLMARLMWDRNADVGALEKRYYDALYGEAGKEVLEYYRLLESRLRKVRLLGLEGTEPILPRLLALREDDEESSAFTVAAYWPVLEDLSRIVERAKTRALKGDERERLARLVDHHELLLGTIRGMVAAGRLQDQLRKEDLKMLRDAVDIREAARGRLRAYSPTLAAQLGEDDTGSLSELSPKGALYRLASGLGGEPIRVAIPDGGFESPDLDQRLGFTPTGGARLTLEHQAHSGRQSIRVSVPKDADASLSVAAGMSAGKVYRLSLAYRMKGALPRYDHTRQAPLITILSRKNRRTPLFRSGVPALADVLDWRSFHCIFEVPGDGDVIRLSFPLQGEFDLDDVVLEQL